MTRQDRCERLADHFHANLMAQPIEREPERWAAVALEQVGDQVVSASISTFNTVDEAFEELGSDVLEGRFADGVYDQDTGEKIDVHISTPIVTASEDQDVTYNPLSGDL
jgi:hypothetical protein